MAIRAKSTKVKASDLNAKIAKTISDKKKLIIEKFVSKILNSIS